MNIFRNHHPLILTIDIRFWLHWNRLVRELSAPPTVVMSSLSSSFCDNGVDVREDGAIILFAADDVSVIHCPGIFYIVGWSL